jgi:hypothetical protein
MTEAASCFKCRYTTLRLGKQQLFIPTAMETSNLTFPNLFTHLISRTIFCELLSKNNVWTVRVGAMKSYGNVGVAYVVRPIKYLQYRHFDKAVPYK